MKDYAIWTAYRNTDYGYSRMTIHNKTHISMEQVSVDKVSVTSTTVMGSYGPWKTWKVMEIVILISRPGKSWNLSKGGGKAWKSINMLSEKIQNLETGFNFSRNRQKHASYHFLRWKIR